MKKKINLIVLVSLLLVMVLSFSSCGIIGTACVACVAVDYFQPENKVKLGLPKYEYSECYSHGDFQDFTFYNKYYYDIDLKELDSNKFLQKIDEDDITEIKGYVDEFEGWIELFAQNEEKQEIVVNYDFNNVDIEVGDYFYIEDKYGEEWKYSSFDIYYFDVETQIMYFMHNNI